MIQGQFVARTADLSLQDMQKEIQDLKTAKRKRDEGAEEEDEKDEDPAPQTKKRPCSNSKEKAAEAAPKAKKRAAPKAQSCKRKAADAAPKTNANGLPPYPGQPKKAVRPVHVKDFALYTDMRMRAWRLKRHGERRDKAFSFRKDPKGAWNKLWKVIRTG